jgi:hypothetical protein
VVLKIEYFASCTIACFNSILSRMGRRVLEHFLIKMFQQEEIIPKFSPFNYIIIKSILVRLKFR